MTKKPGPMFWLVDNRGVYIPRDFANCFTDRAKSVTGVGDEDWTTLEAGPEADGYWDAWDNVLQDAVVTDDNGVKYRLHQDGDLWLVPEGMEWSDEDGFVWPDEAHEDEHAVVTDAADADVVSGEEADIRQDTEGGWWYHLDENIALGPFETWAEAVQAKRED